MLLYQKNMLKDLLKDPAKISENILWGKNTRLYSGLESDALFVGIEIIYSLDQVSIGATFAEDDTRIQAKKYLDLLTEKFPGLKLKTLYFDVIRSDLPGVDKKRMSLSKILIYAHLLERTTSLETEIINTLANESDIQAVKVVKLDKFFFNIESPLILNNGYQGLDHKEIFNITGRRYIWNFKNMCAFDSDNKIFPDDYIKLQSVAFNHGARDCETFRGLIKDHHFEKGIEKPEEALENIQDFLDAIGAFKFRSEKDNPKAGSDSENGTIFLKGIRIVYDNLKDVKKLFDEKDYKDILAIYLKKSVFMPEYPSGEIWYQSLTNDQKQKLVQTGFSKEDAIDARNNEVKQLYETGLQYSKHYLHGFFWGLLINLRKEDISGKYFSENGFYCVYKGKAQYPLDAKDTSKYITFHICCGPDDFDEDEISTGTN